MSSDNLPNMAQYISLDDLYVAYRISKFRVVGRHPVDFHIVSALWIQKVGHQYDAVLGTCAYASRVRRLPSETDHSLGGPCPTSLGSFRHYSFGFRNWRANGLKAMS